MDIVPRHSLCDIAGQKPDDCATFVIERCSHSIHKWLATVDSVENFLPHLFDKCRVRCDNRR